MPRLRTAGCLSIAGSLLILGSLGYFVTGHHGAQVVDGLGRSLRESPWFMRLVFGQQRLWAGWTWFFADLIIFWGGVALAMRIGGLRKETFEELARTKSPTKLADAKAPLGRCPVLCVTGFG